jgi:predicted MFS family arabinose efflux permease
VPTDAPPPSQSGATIGANAWRGPAAIAFALTFALMLSDFMTRSVISAVLPQIKLQWTLTDRQLGALLGIVPLIVGLASWPISLLADRVGHVRSVTAMAALWCLATIASGLSQNVMQMLIARGLVGLGEAAFTSVGGAILAAVFPARHLAAVMGAFSAAAVFGAVLGVALGGVIAAVHGWRAAFVSIGAASLVLVVLYPWLVKEPVRAGGTAAAPDGAPRVTLRGAVRALFARRAAVYAFVASGLQMFVVGMLGAWMPSFFTRDYDMPPDAAALRAAGVILAMGFGMVAGGFIADRVGRFQPHRRLMAAAAYALVTWALLVTAFVMSPGPGQLALLMLGALSAAAHSGVSGAFIVAATHPAPRATALATLVLFNNLLGIAPGAFAVGWLAEATGLTAALTIASAVGLLAALCFWIAARSERTERLSNTRIDAATSAP